jgi:hypothetical protein
MRQNGTMTQQSSQNLTDTTRRGVSRSGLRRARPMLRKWSFPQTAPERVGQGLRAIALPSGVGREKPTSNRHAPSRIARSIAHRFMEDFIKPCLIHSTLAGRNEADAGSGEHEYLAYVLLLTLAGLVTHGQSLAFRVSPWPKFLFWQGNVQGNDLHPLDPGESQQAPDGCLCVSLGLREYTHV